MGLKKLPKGVVDVFKVIGAVILVGSIAIAGAMTGCVKDVFSQPPQIGGLESDEAPVTSLPDEADGGNDLDGVGQVGHNPYRPRPGLDPIAQSLIRSREEQVRQSRRVRLLERQVAQLQRIIFRDPTIHAPHHPPVPPLPPGLGDDGFPFGAPGAAGAAGEAGPRKEQDK